MAEYKDVITRFNPDAEIEEEFLLLFMDAEKTLFVKPGGNVEIIKEYSDEFNLARIPCTGAFPLWVS